MRVILLFIFAIIVSSHLHAANQKLTIYSKATPGSIDPSSYHPVPGQVLGFRNAGAIPGYAVVRDIRQLTLEDSVTNHITFSDVAAYIDPTTVTFRSLTDPNTHVLTQRYRFDLVNKRRLLERFLTQEIEIEQHVGDDIETIEGVLLGIDGPLTIQDSDGKILSIKHYQTIRFPKLPGGLMTKPTLFWDVVTEKSGVHQVETSYQTNGVSWWADYNVLYYPDTLSIDLSAWVSIINYSGVSYKDAAIKLMAGDVKRAQSDRHHPRMLKEMARVADAPQFKEKAFFEYHLYQLIRPESIYDKSTTQIELFPTITKIPVEKYFTFRGQRSSKVAVSLTLTNSVAHKMGIPLPSGRIRVNQADVDGSLEFIGEDVIDHTAKDEEVEIAVGNAFDIKGDRKVVASSEDRSRRMRDETIEITLRNHKKEKIAVKVIEQLQYATNWRLESSQSYKKTDANTVEFILDLDPDATKKLRYNVHYKW